MSKEKIERHHLYYMIPTNKQREDLKKKIFIDRQREIHTYIPVFRN